MIEIKKDSKEYLIAQSKAINVLYFSKYNNGMYEQGSVSKEYWSPNSTLFKDDTCYVLMDKCGSYHRWGA